MSLTNEQYDTIMRIYSRRQADNRFRQKERQQAVYDAIPAFADLETEISSLQASRARLMLGDQTGQATRCADRLHTLCEKRNHLLAEHGFPADYLKPHYICPDCQDTGYIGTEKCHCLKQAVVQLLYSQSNLNDILEEENFSKCSLDYYSSNHIDPLTGRSSLESMQTALKICHAFVDTFSEEFHNILLYGDTGVGKTFLSHCIAKELMDASYSVIYLTSDQLFKIFAQNTFGKKADKDEEAYEHIYNCDLLIIDDLGTEGPNSFTVSQLFVCMNERILRRKSTIISTNLALDDIKNIYSERIFSRISSNYTILRLTGDDIRIQKKLLNLGGTRDVTT